MREAAANLSVSGGIGCKLTYERGCARRLLTLITSGAVASKLIYERRYAR